MLPVVHDCVFVVYETDFNDKTTEKGHARTDNDCNTALKVVWKDVICDGFMNAENHEVLPSSLLIKYLYGK